MLENVKIEKLVHGGQGIGTLSDGRRVFVWNVIPDEVVNVRLVKSKKGHAEGIAEEIISPSGYRETPKDEAYLSTSPWQMMDFSAENKFKADILTETMQREHVAYTAAITLDTAGSEWHYRNTIEVSFWAGDSGLHLALFYRGTHRKQIIEGSSIAMPIIDETARKIVQILNTHGIRGSQLKTVVVRANQSGRAVAALFVKDELFPELQELATVCSGIAVYYSTPKSPASVLTKDLYHYGDLTLMDTIGGCNITYDVNSFFQVNLPVFTKALEAIRNAIGEDASVDMYSGVGTIGIPAGAYKLVELDEHNVAMARQNIGDKATEVVHASAEAALEHITSDTALIVDPPRAGLHQKVTAKMLEALPPKIVYLSCNPITQARDMALLQTSYEIESIQGYNFFPKTPHIESLAVLKRKAS